jgi:hypothetical protein
VRDLRVVELVLGLPWLDDEQASLQFGTTRVFTMMDGTTVEIQTEKRRPKCVLMSYGKVHKLMRKTRQSKGHKAEFTCLTSRELRSIQRNFALERS